MTRLFNGGSRVNDNGMFLYPGVQYKVREASNAAGQVDCVHDDRTENWTHGGGEFLMAPCIQGLRPGIVCCLLQASLT